MTKKIFRSIFTSSVCTLAAALIIIFGVLYGYFTETAEQQLRNQLSLAVQGVELCGTEYLDRISEDNIRLTLIDPDGTVLFDTNADPADMDNHSGREEIKAALEKGTGESSRFSATLLEKTIYRAEKLTDGRILRISATRHSVLLLALGIMQPSIVVIMLALILSAYFAGRMSKRIVEPLNALDLDRPLENNAYDEVAPLLSHIEQQNRKIREQIAELKRTRTEFEAITDGMDEALVLLGADGKVISINRAAETLFDTDSECIGKSFLTIERNHDICEAIENAQKCGHSELDMERSGRVFRLNISRIGGKTTPLGTVILAFDVTDRVFAERNRREFTANVSHELKTPLQSIMGNAELIESGIAKEADVPRFASAIRSEAKRLVTLIEDIIRLSQLDEKAEMQTEQLDLLEIASETVSELKYAAEKGHISMTVCGESSYVTANRRLVCEMLFNICDNAVKYNREGGNVTVSVSAEEHPKVVVKDTGIGIPQEHIDRIFERFYRVDKSRSNETGGTGLGLSIVKHAAECLGAKVLVSSTPGEGTCITVEWEK